MRNKIVPTFKREDVPPYKFMEIEMENLFFLSSLKQARSN